MQRNEWNCNFITAVCSSKSGRMAENVHTTNGNALIARYRSCQSDNASGQMYWESFRQFSTFGACTNNANPSRSLASSYEFPDFMPAACIGKFALYRLSYLSMISSSVRTAQQWYELARAVSIDAFSKMNAIFYVTCTNGKHGSLRFQLVSMRG